MKKLILPLLAGAIWLLNTAAWGGEAYRADVSTALTVRSIPSATGAAIGSLARHANVDVQRFVGSTQTLGGRSGRWAEITYDNEQAYVFGGFLQAVNATSGNGGHIDVLARLQSKYPDYYAKGVFLVDDSDQRMYWYKDGELMKTYRISTAAKGLGFMPESNQTPSGAHRIASKIGKNAKRGMVFDKLTPTGEIAKIYTKPQYGVKALVLSRILRLDGLEPGKNKGGRVDTFNRAIYFHGTNKEGNLGVRASHGCIRMNNDEIIDLFDRVSVDTLVYIQP
ncbi:MAG: hypothetical protein RI964_2504 [Pseudomonadota bacterium]